MSSIDRRVVEAKFDNKQFHAGVKNTLDDISALNKGLRFDGATKGLTDVQRASGRFNLTAMSDSVNRLASQFDTLRVVGVAVLSTLATKAVMAGGQMAKSMTIGPLIEGLREYETNLNSIQTILSNTQWEDKTLLDVNQALGELNEYADLTIYNFAEMARNIGTFTAAGVELDVSVQAIKGIANLAAVSGANAQQAATAMYQLSQALSTGTVKLMDWNSVVNAGMGGKVFQDAVKETARAHGVAIDEIIERNGSFRDSLQEGWFTAEILTDTLAGFTGDLNEAQLASMGYTEEQIEGILEMGQTAVDAATKVKTATQLVDTVKEAIGTGWADTWQIIFGDFEEARELWTGVNDFLGEYIGKVSDARNEVLTTWKEMGGRTAVIDGIVNAFESLFSVIAPIKEAFQDFFPGITGEQLYNLSVGFRDFFETFKMGEEDAENLKRTFDGVFGAIGIGWEVLKEIGNLLGEVLSYIFTGADDLLEVTGNLGETISDFYERIKEGEDLAQFFDNVTGYIINGVDALRDFAEWLRNVFAFNTDEFADSMSSLAEAGRTMAPLWEKIAAVVGAVIGAVAIAFQKVGSFIMELPARIADYLSGVDWSLVLSSINTGLFGAFLIMFNNLVNNIGGKGLIGALSEVSEGFSGAMEGITDGLDRVTGTLGTMQNTLRAFTLLQIAAALGIMALSLTQLARIDPADLAKALSAMAALFVELGAALVALNAIGGIKGIGLTATSLVVLAVAIRIFVGAIEDLAELSWEDLQKGLLGLSGVLAAVIATASLMPNTKGMISTATGLLILSGAIKILASAVTDLSGMSWEEMGRGLAGIGALLSGLAIFTRLAAVNKGGIAQGAGLVLVAGAIKILASAAGDFANMNVGEIVKGLGAITAILAAFAGFSHVVNPSGIVRTGAALVLVSGAMYIMAEATQQFSQLSWGEIARGLVAMGGALVLVGTALTLIPATALASAGSLVVASVGLLAIGKALEQMGGMDWEEIGKGLLVLGASLALLAVGLTAMSGTLLGSASLLVAAAALTVLTPVLFLLGGLSWEAIGKGMVVLAGAFAILGAAGYLLAPTVPTFLGLAAAFLILGGGVALLGIGVNLLATAFATLANVGTDVGTTIAAVIGAVGEAIPLLGDRFAQALINFITTLAASFDKLLDAIVVILSSILDAVVELIPDIVEAGLELANALLEAMITLVPKMANTALDVMDSILNALIEKAPTIVGKMIELVTAILNEMAARVPDFADAATALVVALLVAIADNMGDVITAGADIVIAFIEGMQENSNRIIDAGMEAVLDFINGVTDSIDRYAPELRSAGIRLAGEIADGMTFGMASKVGDVVNGAKGLAESALSAAADRLGIRSPSKEFRKLGKFVGDGFIKGMQDSKNNVLNTYDTMWALLQDARRKAKAERKRLDAEMERLQAIEEPSEKVLRRMLEVARAQGENLRELWAVNDAIDYMSKAGKKQRNELARLGRQHEINTQKLQNAERALQDARQARDDYSRSVRDQMNDIPDISQGYGVERFTYELEESISKLSKFTSVMAKLRKMGLGDAMYEELLSQGPGALRFAEELLSGGRRSIREVNDLTTQLARRSNRLGNVASRELYQAGVDSAQGLVDGLKKKEKAIDKQMQKIAKALAAAVKKELGIRSPSKVMEELGGFTVEGMALGMQKSIPQIEKAASGAGQSAIDAMKKSISDMSEIISMETDMNPTIKPIIDMSEIKKGAAEINAAMSDKQLLLDSAYSKAKNASMRYQANREAALEPDRTSELAGVNMTYNQYNNSPKALSPAEIYRQTRNQLSTTKGALTNAT